MIHTYVFWLCMAMVACCCIAGVITYFIYGWTIRYKITLCIMAVTAYVFIGASVVFIKQVAFLWVVAFAIIFGVISHFVITLFVKDLIKPIEEINKCLDLLTAGNFTQKIDVKSGVEIRAIMQKINAMTTEMSVLINQIKYNSNDNMKMTENLFGLSGHMSEKAETASIKINSVAESANNMRQNMKAASSSMESASSNIETVASAIEGTSSTISSISNHVEEARAISEDGVSHAKRTSEKVKDLGQAAGNISKVTETITEISEQTNLLALNATIEAARAGDTGKGFAVVAGEIKELARQTAEATQEIKGMIEKVQQTASGTVAETELITKVINDGNEKVSTIAASIEEQSAITREIADNVGRSLQVIMEARDNVAQSMNASEQIADDVTIVNQDAGEISNSSSNMKTNIEALAKLAETLQERADKFIIEN